MLAFEWLDVSCEYLINEESTFGPGALIGSNNLKNYGKFSLIPYYRRFFSNKFAKGFLLKGS
ncbi:hypothetical protein CW731_08690 [Polaribacter sp. ALD11]|nr:hypothetical protein CW731_08690 [Polaribacter sp. ALD11]